MTIEQRARDSLNADLPMPKWDNCDRRDNHPVMRTVCRALEAHDETQAAFDVYRREVSEAIAYCVGQGMSGHHRDTLERFIISEPVDPLVQVFRTLPLNGDAGCDKLTDAEWLTVANAARDALAKGEGA